MSVTLQQMYLWALRDQERLDAWDRNGIPLDAGKRHDRDCAAGTVRLLDLILSNTAIINSIKSASDLRQVAAKAASAPAEARAS